MPAPSHYLADEAKWEAIKFVTSEVVKALRKAAKKHPGAADVLNSIIKELE